MSTASDPYQEADSSSAARALATPSARFDVFLSHRSADMPVIEAIARALQQRGPVPWRDGWEMALDGVVAAVRAARPRA